MGVPYEVTLELLCDGEPYGRVGERCGWQLARLARGVAEARAEEAGGTGNAGSDGDAAWPDPDDRFPGPPEGEGELFAFRYRSHSGVMGGGELRCRLRTIATWVPAQQGGRGEWRVIRRAFLEAWGATGVGLRAVLTSAELGAFVGDLVEEAERRLGARYAETQRNSNLIRETGTAVRPG
jgi:hypothetical protein